MAKVFLVGQSVDIIASEDEIIKHLTHHSGYSTAEARMIALLMQKYGGEIIGMLLDNGKTYYAVDVGPESETYLLPGKFLETKTLDTIFTGSFGHYLERYLKRVEKHPF